MLLKNLIKQKREEKGMSMNELARKVGVSQSTITRWERGDIATMKQSKIVALASALGVSPAEIIDMPISLDATRQELNMLYLYRQLTPDQQQAVDILIDTYLAQNKKVASSDATAM